MSIFKEKYIELPDKTKIFTKSIMSGKEKTVIFIHGGPGNGCWDLDPFLSRLSSKYNVLTFDERGVNKSDETGEDFTSEMLINDIEEIKNIFGIDKACFIGHSYGGHLLLRYCIKYPNSVLKAVFMCPSFSFTDSLTNVCELSIDMLNEQGNTELSGEINRMLSSGDFSDVFKGLSMIPEDVQSAVYGYDNVPCEISELISQNAVTEEEMMKSMKHQQAVFTEGEINRDYTDRLGELSNNTMLLVGEKDPVCSKYQWDKYVNSVAEGKAVSVKNCYHFPYLEAIEESADITEDFFQ